MNKDTLDWYKSINGKYFKYKINSYKWIIFKFDYPGDDIINTYITFKNSGYVVDFNINKYAAFDKYSMPSKFSITADYNLTISKLWFKCPLFQEDINNFNYAEQISYEQYEQIEKCFENNMQLCINMFS